MGAGTDHLRSIYGDYRHSAGVQSFREQEIDSMQGDWNAGRPWDILLNYTVPLLACVLLGWWLWLSATVYAPDTWYNPTDPFSLMTCIVQWGTVIAILLLLNRMLAKRIRSVNLEAYIPKSP